ncbi:ketose-bisphosphate aldolase [Schaalia sp. 19OD2882]|uniref:class II fructose-bisphosphate aldolase n=1 Tax=Schaalia sp. 19OD2882 TaxID=2794089 RepID=UPI001C1EC3B6|nr:ketose-bisphosphate aldolase [Schaalia sp. 19OD2882]QWW20196.1 ketose-bisphosphate aldolase [Schaalia sp. 19OD2882]
MPSEFLRPMSDLLVEAERGGYAVGAFNCSTLEQVAAVVEVANREHSPVIVQMIAGVGTLPDAIMWPLARSVVEATAQVPVALHLDHGRTYEDCARAIDCGFTSVMRDASRDEAGRTPLSLEDNIAETLRVVTLAAGAGVSVEGEVGTVGGGGEGAGMRGAFDFETTSVEDAVHFARTTGVDAMALAVGTSHGAVKFPVGAQPELRFDLIEQVHRALPEVALVLHGSSTCPHEDVARVNAHGGRVSPSSGITAEDKRRAVALGMRKINQGTDSNLAWTGATRAWMGAHRDQVDPWEVTRAGMEAMQVAVARAMEVFGSTNRV